MKAQASPYYNLAVGGWGPESYLAAYEKFGADREHARVAVFTFINDITDVLNWRVWQASGKQLSFMSWIQSENPDGEHINTENGWLDRRSLAWNLVRFFGSGPSSETSGPAVAPQSETFPNGQGGTFAMQFIAGQVFAVNDPAAFQPGGSYYPYLQEYFESLERLRLAIEARGARMVLFWIPSKERVHLPLLDDARRSVHVSNVTKDVGGIEPVLAQYASQAGVPFLDLTPAFTAAAKGGEQLYFTIDGHLNSRGNALLGTLAAEFLRLPRDPAPASAIEGTWLPYRSGHVEVVEPIAIADSVASSPLVQPRGTGWTVAGTAESRFSYILQWPEHSVTTPMFVIVRGRLRTGGLTIGVLDGDQWAATLNVTAPGRFDVALPVTASGRYRVTVAHALPESSLRTDFDVDEIGWAPVAAGGQRHQTR